MDINGFIIESLVSAGMDEILANEKVKSILSSIDDVIMSKLMPANYYLDKGWESIKQGKYYDSIVLFDLALIHKPNWGRAYYHRAISYAKLELIDESVDDLNKAIIESKDWLWNARKDSNFKNIRNTKQFKAVCKVGVMDYIINPELVPFIILVLIVYFIYLIIKYAN